MSRLKPVSITFLCIVIMLVISGQALSQTYIFGIDQLFVDVYWNEDGTQSLDYQFQFVNSPQASPLDFVDVGLPNQFYDINSIIADVDGIPLTNIEKSPYVEHGVAIALENHAIKPGFTGTVNIFVGKITKVLYTDDQDENYTSAVFSTTYFGSEFLRGSTDLTVTFHLPPGIVPEEPRWHASPSGFPSEPETGFDEQGRITYTWKNPTADVTRAYKFGASFPQTYVPISAIVRPGILETLGIDIESLFGFSICCGIITFFIVIIFIAIRSSNQRKLKYLPPKISIEGHGIKRGLTAIEAAILLEQPLDKVLTLILFSVIKKNAASVIQRDPLQLKVAEPLPAELRPYEVKFLEAFNKSKDKARRIALQDTIIDLVKTISEKMKGFSRKETIEYYTSIVERAWLQVEAADTPEVKSQKYDDVMEWTMLDKDYDDRTRRVFQQGPVYAPVWWPRYDPTFKPATTMPKTASPTSVGKSTPSLPHLPGSDFAASMVNGVQSFSAGVIGSLTDFTSRVTDKTNPVPVTTTRTTYSRGGGGGGCACACACACAGCACACAGGGR